MNTICYSRLSTAIISHMDSNHIAETTSSPSHICTLHSGVEQRLVFAEFHAKQLSEILQRISKLEARITIMFALGMPVVSAVMSALVYFLTRS